MNRFARWIVKHRVAVVIICLLMLIPSVLGMNATKVKYDLLYYLPEDLDTVKGQNILMEEFGKGAFSLCITEGMSETDQQALEDAIRDVPHVDTVIGYASITKGTIPSEILPDEYRDIFEKGDARLMAVFFDDTSSAEGTMEAIAQIRKIAGQQCFVSGLSAVVTDTKQLVEDQEAIYVAIAVALCCVVLMLTMDSILLPFIFLLCIGVSILWNMGTNYFLGEISYITKAVAAVLQLGVTLDYSIFLWHSYKEEQQTYSDKDEAMASAICKTISSIVGSSLTTVAGFVAICFMSFTLGRDLGIVMSKGVILGVLGTVILLPCVIRLLDRALEKADAEDFVRGLNQKAAAAYESVTGHPIDMGQVSDEANAMQRIIDHFGLLSFIDAAKALMTCPHYMMAHPEEGYIGTYFYIVMNGIQDFVPFIWRSGDPPRRMTVEQLPHDMVTQDMPGLYNRRLQKPDRRKHLPITRRDPRPGGDTRHHLPLLTAGTVQPNEKIYPVEDIELR